MKTESFFDYLVLPSRALKLVLVVSAAAALSFAVTTGTVIAADDEDEAYHEDYIFGVPEDPTEAWTLANGARLYDNWPNALGADQPSATHASYPAEGKEEGASTWRCKECHGWDYKGVDGAYGSGSHFTGIKGIAGAAGKDPEEIHQVLLNETHSYTHDMIPMDAMLRLATFVSKGQVDTDQYIGADKSVKGDAAKGAPLYQNICAACHGFNGKAINWGDEDDPGFVGTEAQGNPWEVLHKIRFGHPGHEMPAMVALPVQTAVDILAYTQTLPAK